MGEWPPVARNEDPWSSHVAAERIEPKRGTRRARVLDLLRLRLGEWIPGHLFTRQDAGGSEGLRRLRELRQLGWPVERRPSRTKGATGWEYRLAPPPEPPPAPVPARSPDVPPTLFDHLEDHPHA